MQGERSCSGADSHSLTGCDRWRVGSGAGGGKQAHAVGGGIAGAGGYGGVLVGGVVLAAVSLSGWLGRGRLAGTADAPWWTWPIMATGLFAVVSIIVLLCVGTAVR